MSNSGQLNFGIFTGSPLSIQSPYSYNDGQWHQVVATEGPNGLNMYVDGQLVTNNTTTSLPRNYLGYWRVGYEDASGWNGSPTNSYFAGTISDVAFYNVELSSTQVSTQYSQSGIQRSAPSGVVAVPGDAAATLSWNTPADNGFAITGYVVTPYQAGVAQPPVTFNSAALTQDLTALTNGSSYTFTVAGKNNVATGPQSAASSAVVIGAPKAPTNVRATRATGSARVSWTAPSSNNGSPISGYLITPYVGLEALPPRRYDSTLTNQTVTGLQKGTTYQFTVAAINGRGTGPESLPSNAVSPK
jgi:hypothetical protein